MTDQEHNAIEKSVDDAIWKLIKRRMGKRCADLWDRIGAAYPRAERLPSGTADLKRLALESLLMARQRSLSCKGISESIRYSVRDDDRLFFQLLGEVLASPLLDDEDTTDKYDSFLVLNWLERTPVRLRDKRLVVSLRRPSKRISAGNPLPGLCQFTDRAIAEYFALVKLREFGPGLRGIGEQHEAALKKRRSRLGLVPASQKIVREVKMANGRIDLKPFGKGG